MIVIKSLATDLPMSVNKPGLHVAGGAGGDCNSKRAEAEYFND